MQPSFDRFVIQLPTFEQHEKFCVQIVHFAESFTSALKNLLNLEFFIKSLHQLKNGIIVLKTCSSPIQCITKTGLYPCILRLGLHEETRHLSRPLKCYQPRSAQPMAYKVFVLQRYEIQWPWCCTTFQCVFETVLKGCVVQVYPDENDSCTLTVSN